MYPLPATGADVTLWEEACHSEAKKGGKSIRDTSETLGITSATIWNEKAGNHGLGFVQGKQQHLMTDGN